MKKIKVSEENTQVVNNDDYTIALLIDAENISYKYIPTLLEQLKSFGNITIRRVYGDFTSQILKPWKEICNEFSIKPIQGNVISTGKNNSDSVLIIDAMDILHDHRVDAFCLATSDSDFTSLAIRIREDGYFVIGAGEDKTSKAFIETCARFIRLGEEKQISKPKKTKTNSKSKSSSKKNEADSRKNLFPDLSEEDMKKIDEIKARSYLILENREKLTITGVVDVLSFDDQIVIVETQLGLLTVKGEDLRINKLSIDSLEVIIEGQIYNMGYSNDEIGKKNSGSLLGKIFK